ncbi:protein of unknown function [Candidatus Nitrospira inopinata]|uniref:Uncharacterized protein n=1 Tax=Candidatus Nitrospira inopinata TaxID=1715989 RepID=A0A0S4KKQ7_9BACT|nr:protein of unknown function [Candidatus Nitrospira inopinata]
MAGPGKTEVFRLSTISAYCRRGGDAILRRGKHVEDIVREQGGISRSGGVRNGGGAGAGSA